MPIDRSRRIIDRLRRMGSDEILERTRQAAAKRADGVLRRLGYDFGISARRAASFVPGKFFFSPDSVESILALIRLRLPESAERTVQDAESILHHKLDLLGYSQLDYNRLNGREIDWHWDAVHEERAPKKPFYQIRYLDYAECGDSKVIWELNRHQHLVTLARACRFTGDQRYVDEILRQKRHWEVENPYPIGINWASSLEAAFRSLSWLWTFHLLEPSTANGLRSEWLNGLALHGRHIERYLSTYFSPNTHLLGEGVALFFLGVLCPELAAAQRWKTQGWAIVLMEAERQVGNDGFHFERSTYYHLYALDFFLHAAVLAAANGIAVPPSLHAVIEKMLTALYLMGRYGPPPQFGDDDGGRLFDPHRNSPEHYLDPLATGAILFQRGDYKSVAGRLREETLWLLGEDGARQWDQLQDVAASRDSAALPEAGYFLLATETDQLVVDAGPLGAQSAGHGHADALSVCLQSRGHTLLADPGTSEYVGPDGDRDVFRGTRMHNTLLVDGLGQTEPATVFSWSRLTQSTVEQWSRGKRQDLLVASHDGFQGFSPPIKHRRAVVSLKNGTYLVRDVVEGSGKHRVEIAWHLGAELEIVEQFVFRVRGKSVGLALVPAEGFEGTAEVQDAFCSPRYGQKRPAKVLTFSGDFLLPAEFAVLLITLPDVSVQPGSFKRMRHSPESGLSHYEYQTEDCEYAFVFSDLAAAWRIERLSSDAKYVGYKRGPGSARELTLAGGSHAGFDGGVQLRAGREVEWAEFVQDGFRREILCSDPSAMVDSTVLGPKPEGVPANSRDV